MTTSITEEAYAIQYCYDHEDEYKSAAYASGEDGEEQFNCLIEGLRSGSIKPKELPDYGMDYKCQF